MTGPTTISGAFGDQYVPAAVYLADSDCVEYVREDVFSVYERVDDFLTLIFDSTKYTLIGFKLKGFRSVFRTHMQAKHRLGDEEFVRIVSVLEAVCTELGDSLFQQGDDRVARGYQAAIKLAANDNVVLHAADAKRAA